MSVFEYFWDRPAGLLIVTCTLPQQVGAAFALVSRDRDGDMPEPVAVVPLRPCSRNMATTFAIPAPKEGELAGDRLEFRLVCEDGRDDDPDLTDQIVLDPSEGDGHLRMDVLNWSVLAAQDGPALDLSLPGDVVPAGQLISRVLASRRDGSRVAPGSLGNGAGNGAAVQISAGWSVPAPLGDDPVPAGAEQVVRLTIRPSAPGMVPMPTVFHVHSLMAGSHVCALIEDPDLKVDPRSCNHAELRMTQQARQVQAEFPRSGAGPHDQDAFPLGLLDRIVISSSPPAEFSHVEEADRPRIVGRDGVAVLAFGHDGTFRSDEGVLLSRMIASVKSHHDSGVVDLVSGLADYGLAVSRTELDAATDVSVVLSAETAREVGARLPMLRPNGVAQFRAAPQFFAAVAGLDRDRFPADVVARLAQAARLDTGGKCALLGRMLLERQIEQDEDSQGGRSETDQNRLSLWLESDRATGLVVLAVALSRRLQDVIRGGIAPDWHEIGLLMTSPPDYLRDLERLVVRMTRAGVIPYDAEGQFITLSGSRQHLRRLRRTRSGLADHLVQMNATLGNVVDLPDNEEALIDMLSDMAGPGDQTPRPLRLWLEEHLRPQLPPDLAMHPKPPILARIVQVMARGLRPYYEHIPKFVAAGFSNPLRSVALPMGMEEMQATGPSPLRVPKEAIEWLMSEMPVPDCVGQWKATLRHEYESRSAGADEAIAQYRPRATKI